MPGHPFRGSVVSSTHEKSSARKHDRASEQRACWVALAGPLNVLAVAPTAIGPVCTIPMTPVPIIALEYSDPKVDLVMAHPGLKQT